MKTTDHELLMLGYSGELSIKAKGTRQRFADRLGGNLKDGLRSVGVETRVERLWARLLVHDSSPQAEEIARRVFGISAVMPTWERRWEQMSDLVEEGAEIFAPAVAGRTFAVRVSRGGQRDRVPFRSPDLERELGAKLVVGSAGVDLGTPEIVARVELEGRRAFFAAERRNGEGGLPLGVEGRALCLISGGFDSAVAAWMMMKRGVEIDYVFFALGGDSHRDQVLTVAKHLADHWSYGTSPRLYSVDFEMAVSELRQRCPQRLWQVILKRQMLRAANLLAAEKRYPVIVTGEALGQVSSQTLVNLATISAASDLPVMRPLVGFNKEEIIALARQIGTHDLCKNVPEYCALAARYPETRAGIRKAERGEVDLDPALLTRLVDQRASFELRLLHLDRHRSAGLEIEETPAGADLVDLRSRRAYDMSHLDGARNVEYPAALKAVSAFALDRTWVFYCEVGLKSAHLAELVTARGGKAFCLGRGWNREKAATTSDEKLLQAMSSPVVRK